MRTIPFAAFVQALAVAGALLAAGEACPHATQLSSARVQVAGHAVNARLELNARDLEVALGTALLDPAGSVSPSALRESRPAVGAYIVERTRVFNAAGGTCRAGVGRLEPKGDHVLAELSWRCPPLAGALIYECTLFHEVDPAARHMLTASGDVRRMGLLSVATPRMPR